MQPAQRWNQAPAVTRAVVGASALVSLVITVVPPLGYLFSLSVAGVSYGYIFPLFFNFLGGSLGSNPVMGLLMLLMITLMALSYFPTIERELGSLRFAAWLCMTSATVGVVFLSVTWLLSWTNADWMYSSCSGLWPLMLVALTQRCLEDPTQLMSFWGLVQIPSRWYPIVLTVFFSVLGMRIDLSLFSAVLVGIGASHACGSEPFPRLQWLKVPLLLLLPSVETAAWFEQGADAGQKLSGGTPFCSRLLNTVAKKLLLLGAQCPQMMRACYVSANDAGVMPKALPVLSSEPAGQAQRFVAFAGSGHRLGCDEP